MKRILPALLSCALALGAAAVYAGTFDVPPTPEGERQLLKQLSIDADAKLSYLDIQGKALTFVEFLAQVNGGQGWSLTKTSPGNLVKFQIQKKLTAEEAAALREKEAAAFKVKAGQPLPDFLLKGLDGKLHDKGTLAGKYSVLSFFFEACAPCIAEVPSLNKFRELHPELNLVAVTFDDQAKAQRFLDRHKLNWPVLIESRAFNQSLGINSYPSFAVLDPQGRLLGFKQMGQTPSEDEAAGRVEHAALAAWVKQLLAKDKGG